MREPIKWTDEIRSWILNHPCESRLKKWEMFKKAFPDYCCKTSFYRYVSTMEDINYRTKQGYPLYTERKTSQGIMVKIGLPRTWILKQKFIYMINHPDEDLSETSEYIFLDGDKNNFSSENIDRLPVKIKCNFWKMGGVVEGCPELTRLHLTQAKLKFDIYSAAEKVGLVKRWRGSNRFFIEERRKKHTEYMKEYRNREGNREKHRELVKKYYAEMKQNNPEKYEKYLESQRIEHRKRYKKKKQLLEKN